MNKIVVDGKTWIIDISNHFTQGSDARIYISSDHPQLVLMLFDKSKTYKYDWYKYINLIYGESTYRNNYVLVLPLLSKAAPVPEWYKALALLSQWGVHENMYSILGLDEDIEIPPLFRFSTNFRESDTTDLLRWVYDNSNPSSEMQYWLYQITDFMDKYPQYKTGRYRFDFSVYNIMMDGNRYIITDPIID